MKKIIFSAAALLTFAFAIGQEKAINNAKYGIKGGVNLSSLTGGENVGSIVGGQFGGFVDIKISDKFSIQPELLYSMQGAKDESVVVVNDDPVHVTEHLKLDYLTLPVMAKYYILDRFYIEGGPQVGMLLSAKDKVGAGANSKNVDVADNIESIDFALNVGVGYDFGENAFLGLRYSKGLKNVFAFDYLGEGRNSVLQLTLGYKF